jgi:hypothetical protein
MHNILEFRNPNRLAADARAGRHAKSAGVAVVVALLLLATTQWSPRDASYAHATSGGAEKAMQSSAVASVYFPVPMHHPAPASAPDEHIQAF